jgi:hypothetical protein
MVSGQGARARYQNRKRLRSSTKIDMIWREWVRSKFSRYVSLSGNPGMAFTKTAPLWTGEHDWSLLWVDVYMGEFTCVSCAPWICSSSDILTVAALLVSFTAFSSYGSAIFLSSSVLASLQVQFQPLVGNTIGYLCSPPVPIRGSSATLQVCVV